MNRTEARTWRRLPAHARAILSIIAVRDGTGDDEHAVDTLPRHQRGEYWDVFECGMTVLTHYRPATQWLATLTDSAEAQFELLETMQAWATERAELIAARAPEEQEMLLSCGPLPPDLSLLARADRLEPAKLSRSWDDGRTLLAIKRLTLSFDDAWRTLLALESVLPQVATTLRDDDLVDGLLATQLGKCRTRLEALHAAADDIVGGLPLPEADKRTVASMRALLCY